MKMILIFLIKLHPVIRTNIKFLYSDSYSIHPRFINIQAKRICQIYQVNSDTIYQLIHITINKNIRI